ncbi:MAG: hypothetical protein C0599_07990 [Salinivirgaceae bacterium]|nr:MAG: hypothetical protein C0599_07990 [Salinivirgaceae bacterium]
METNKLDSFFKKAITESENYYDSKADDAKENIWNHIQLQSQSKSKIYLLRLLVAASIVLFIGLSILTILNIQNRNTINTLAELNRKLKNEVEENLNNNLKNESIAANTIIHDTLVVEKKIVEYHPVIKTERITDTVYVEQIVYVEKEQTPVLIATNDNLHSTDSLIQSTGNNYKTEILISKNEPVKKKKRKRFQFRFGNSKNQINDGALALKTNL